MTIINPNSISGISSITALNSTAAINLFKADGTSANIIAGVTTGSNFITGTSNVHSTGYECTNINASGIITAASLDISGDIDFDGHTNLDNVSIAGVTTSTGNIYADNYFANSGLTLNNNGNPSVNITSTSTTGSSRIHFGDPDSGVVGKIYYVHNGDYMQFNTAYGERLRIDSAGNLVLKDHLAQGNSLVNYIQANDVNGAAQYILGQISTGNQDLYLQQTKNANLRFQTNASTRWKIDGNPGHLLPEVAGAVDIGSATAEIRHLYLGDSGSVKLGLEQDAQVFHDGSNFYIKNDTGNIVLKNASADYLKGLTADGSVVLQQNGSARLQTTSTGIAVTGEVAASGNVSCVNLNPTGNLKLLDSTAPDYIGNLYIGNSNDFKLFHNGSENFIRSGPGNANIRIDNNSGVLGAKFVPGGAAELYHNGTKRFETQSTGTKSTGYHTVTTFLYCNEILSTTGTNDDSTSHVSISARNAAGGYGNYFIVGTSGNIYFGAGANSYSSNPSGNNINGGTTIRVYGGISSNAYQDAHRFGRDTDGSIVIFQSAGGTEGSIAISGSTTNYNTSSDYRLKENIVNITDGITRLKQLKPRRFNFIKDPSITKDGFIAHEVDSIVSEAVTGTKDETFSKDDEENNIKVGDPKYQQMDASKLIPLLTAALQEAITEIETLKIKVAALEGA